MQINSCTYCANYCTSVTCSFVVHVSIIYIYILYIYVVLGFAIDIHVALLFMYLLFGGIYCLRVVLYMYFCILFSTVLEDCN